MTNEDKILSMLEGLTEQMTGMNARMDRMEARMDKVEVRLDAMQQDIDQIKDKLDEMQEDIQINRSACETLLAWAEQAEVEVKIPLYRKAQ